MGLESWSFNWQGHAIEVESFEALEWFSQWREQVTRLRIDGKKVREEGKSTIAIFSTGAAPPDLAAQIEGPDGKKHLILVKFAWLRGCRVYIDDDEVFKSNNAR